MQENKDVADLAKRCESMQAAIITSVTAANEDLPSPSWARFYVIPELIQTIERLRILVQREHLFRATAYWPVEFGPLGDHDDDEPARIDCALLEVSDTGFLFSARDHYSDAKYETAMFWFSDAYEQFLAGRHYFNDYGEDEELKELPGLAVPA